MNTRGKKKVRGSIHIRKVDDVSLLPEHQSRAPLSTPNVIYMEDVKPRPEALSM